jgi:hypothetical protein
MTYLAVVLCLFVAGMGALGVLAPARLMSLLRRYETPAGIRIAAAIRIVLGATLFVVAPVSRLPEFIRIFGIVAVAAGVLTPLVGLPRIHKLVEWWAARPPGVFRLWAACALALGLFLTWAVLPGL